MVVLTRNTGCPNTVIDSSRTTTFDSDKSVAHQKESFLSLKE